MLAGIKPGEYNEGNFVTEQCVAIPYRFSSVVMDMMSMSEEVFDEIWVSSNYETVFCTNEEKEQYQRFLSSRKEIPRGMSIVLMNKKLNKPYPKSEIMHATPEQLRSMIK
jgi:hypothetical protein